MIWDKVAVALWVAAVIARSGDQERPRAQFDLGEWWSGAWMDLEPMLAFIGLFHLALDALIVGMLIWDFKRRPIEPGEGKGE